MERMAEAVPFSDDQALQNFLTNSPWNDQMVSDQVSEDANQLIGGRRDSCLIIDESGFPKKGTKSVGVARQWCGQLGKLENCQVKVQPKTHLNNVSLELYQSTQVSQHTGIIANILFIIIKV